MPNNFSVEGIYKPAPRWWRRLERAMLIAFIPGAVAVLAQWKFKDEVLALKIQLLVSTGVVAIIKGVGMLLSNGDEIVQEDELLKSGMTKEKGVWKYN